MQKINYQPILQVGFKWDVLIDGGTVGTIDTGLKFPANTIFYSVKYHNIRTFVSATPGTVSLGSVANPSLITGTQNFTATPYTASGVYEISGRNGNSITYGAYKFNTISQMDLILTIATDDYTDGAAVFFIEYSIPQIFV